MVATAVNVSGTEAILSSDVTPVKVDSPSDGVQDHQRLFQVDQSVHDDSSEWLSGSNQTAS